MNQHIIAGEIPNQWIFKNKDNDIFYITEVKNEGNITPPKAGYIISHNNCDIAYLDYWWQVLELWQVLEFFD